MGELLMQILFSLVEVNLIFSSLVGMGAASSQPAPLPAPGAISRALIMSFIKSQPRQQLHLGMWLLARPFPPCLLLWVLWELIFFFFPVGFQQFFALFLCRIHPAEGAGFKLSSSPGAGGLRYTGRFFWLCCQQEGVCELLSEIPCAKFPSKHK